MDVTTVAVEDFTIKTELKWNVDENSDDDVEDEKIEIKNSRCAPLVKHEPMETVLDGQIDAASEHIKDSDCLLSETDVKLEVESPAASPLSSSTQQHSYVFKRSVCRAAAFESESRVESSSVCDDDDHHDDVLECRRCDVKFNDAFEHARHHVYSCKFLKKQKKKGRPGKNYKCQVCNDTFCLKRDLGTHLTDKHKGFNPLACEFCHKSYSSMTTLRNHVRTHTGEKPHVCRFCEKRFTSRTPLVQHERIHTGERPYKCSFCEKAFTQFSDRVRHLLTHTGVKPFPCDICHKRFTSRAGMRKHMWLHTPDKPVKCQICGMGFGKESFLKRHMIRHSDDKPFECGHCEWKFRNKSELNRHMLVHTGELNHQCEVCGKLLSRANSLREHMKIHTGYRPFVCEFCGRGFSQKHVLITHLKTHEKDR